MKAVHKNTGREIFPGEVVSLYTSQKIAGVEHWFPNGDTAFFEEVTPTGLINFIRNGQPRQCMPEGINARIE